MGPNNAAGKLSLPPRISPCERGQRSRIATRPARDAESIGTRTREQGLGISLHGIQGPRILVIQVRAVPLFGDSPSKGRPAHLPSPHHRDDAAPIEGLTESPGCVAGCQGGTPRGSHVEILGRGLQPASIPSFRCAYLVIHLASSRRIPRPPARKTVPVAKGDRRRESRHDHAPAAVPPGARPGAPPRASRCRRPGNLTDRTLGVLSALGLEPAARRPGRACRQGAWAASRAPAAASSQEACSPARGGPSRRSTAAERAVGRRPRCRSA